MNREYEYLYRLIWYMPEIVHFQLKKKKKCALVFFKYSTIFEY